MTPAGGWILDFMSTTERPRILVVGGGYVGLYAARRILKKMRYGEATVTVVDPRSYMTYQPFLPEAAAGSISPRHVVVPLRRVLPKAEVLTGRVTSIDQDRKVAHVAPLVGEAYELPFDYLVIAMGAVSRTFPIPGLAENGIGMKGVEEAIGLRNHVLEQLDKADSTQDEDARRKALTFVFVGGGFAGAETIGEVEDMARDAAKYYPNVRREDMRFVLVDAAPGILPEVGPKLGEWGLEHLRKRGVEVYLNTSMESCVDGHVVLKNGLEVDSSTIVWTAGVKPNPVLARFGLPLGPKGHVDVRRQHAGQGRGLRLGRGRQRAGPGPGRRQGGRVLPAQRAARAATGQGARGQRHLRDARLPAGQVQAREQGRRGRARSAQGRRDDRLRQDQDQAARPAGLVLPPRATTAWPCRPGTARSGSSPTGRWAMFLKREVVSLGAMEHPRGEFYEAAAPVSAAAIGKSEASAPADTSKATADSRADSPVDGRSEKATASS